MNRRLFLRTGIAAGAMGVAARTLPAAPRTGPRGPIAVHTWDFRLPVNAAAMRRLAEGGSALDAVEAGIRIVEADPSITSVGIGGMPDRDGHLTLDACIMDSAGNAGSVMFLEGIAHPISVARRVMEKTPHVFLAGEGAQQFAMAEGFARDVQLSDNARAEWEKWKTKEGYTPPVGGQNHDTIGMLVMDGEGNLAGGCSTSGLAFKMRGRVGDSPIIGAGLYVDNEVGGATATGLGEAIVREAGSFLIVELMRQGIDPGEACRRAVDRIVRKHPRYAARTDLLAGFVAINKEGEIGAYSRGKGFLCPVSRTGAESILEAPYSTP